MKKFFNTTTSIHALIDILLYESLNKGLVQVTLRTLAKLIQTSKKNAYIPGETLESEKLR